MILIHVALGLLATLSVNVTYYWGISIIVVGLVDIIIHSDRNNNAAKWAAYYVGIEVLLRMTGANVFWEGGKYGIILFLLVGLIVERGNRTLPRVFFLFFGLLLPSLAVIDFPSFQIGREEVSFNLSGPFLLTLSAIYFFRRRIFGPELIGIFRALLYPLLSMLIYLTIMTPDIAEIDYGTESNFTASGGFGPNQVAIAIGLAIFLISFGIFFKSYLIHSLVVDIFVLSMFVFRGLATFSRGGVIGALCAIIVLIAYTLITSKRSSTFSTVLSFLLIISGGGLVVWNYVNEQTSGKLEFRYSGKNFATGQEKDITSGRKEIMLEELNNFYQHPGLGVGPGMGTLIVKNARGLAAHSHSEYTRLLSEHGILGLIAMSLMIFVPLHYIFNMPAVLRPIPLSILCLALFILAHSAMRLAIPGFIYGLTFVIIAKRNREWLVA